MKHRFSWIFIFITITGFSGPALATSAITISTFEEDTAVVRASQLLEKAYENIGVEMKLIRFPANRALVEADNGDLSEGELIRIGGLSRQFHNLIQVPVMIAKFKISVFSKDIDFPVNGWQSLQPYQIAFKRGFKGMEKHADNLNVTRVTSSGTAMEMLSLDRIELIVLPYLDGLVLRKQLNLPQIRVLNPPLEQVNLYHYIHKKNKEIADRLTVELGTMAQNGEIAQFWKNIEDELSAMDD
ncbi:MAG: hypothetical protein MI863_27575 [Desulfobacterales bacterium]|nr:hypothetical protein [Desulfobacterales bacterium]